MDGRVVEGRLADVVSAIVLAGTTGTSAGGLKCEPELALPAPAEVVVQAVVPAESYGCVLDTNGATEELNAVVFVGKHLNISSVVPESTPPRVKPFISVLVESLAPPGPIET